MWEPIVERLGHLRCLVPDLPGHGNSADRPWHSLDATADALAELVAHQATGGRAHVVGLSLGAYVALRLQCRAPSVVNRAVLSGLNVLPFAHPMLVRAMGYLMLPVLKRRPLLRAQAKALRIPGERQDGYIRSAQSMSLRAFLRIGHELMAFHIDPAFRQATHPTLVVAGEREQALIRRSVPEIVGALPDAEGRLVPGVGHGWSGETPELFARTLEAWFAAEPLPAELKRLTDEPSRASTRPARPSP
jgi:pimeloyl-ACP methyl ester carboxylesterase